MKGFTKRGLLVLTALSACLLIISCGEKEKTTISTTGRAPAAIRVDGYIVKTEALAETVEVSGTIIANESTEIHPEIAGRVTYLNVREGAVVNRGTVLARLYDGDLQAQLKKLQVQLQIAEQRMNRLEELQKIGGISKQDYDLSVLEVSNIRSDIAIVRADISKTVVRAPFTGKMGLKNISEGAYVTPATVISTLQQTSRLKLDFTVPEKYSGEITKGKIVNFRVEGTVKPYAARVIATESSVAEATRSLMVRSEVINADGGLLPGAFAKVMLNFDPDPNAMMIPTQAVLPRARGKQVVMYNGGQVNFRDVETGVRDSSRIQVTEGLKPGDTILVTGLLSIRPGSKVQLNEIVE